jgi:hypothetical protein
MSTLRWESDPTELDATHTFTGASSERIREIGTAGLAEHDAAARGVLPSLAGFWIPVAVAVVWRLGRS